MMMIITITQNLILIFISTCAQQQNDTQSESISVIVDL